MRAALSSLCLSLALTLAACGESGEPSPGFAEPCASPMAGVLGCPATWPQDPLFSLYDACAKLVDCGILAADFLGRRGSTCAQSADCDGGECLASDSDSHCYYPLLDYSWCVARLSDPPRDPCGDGREFTVQETLVAIECIEAMACPTIGLPFAVKRDSNAVRDADRFTCENDDSVLTATVCDNGILRY